MGTLSALALRTACRNEAMSATLQVLPAAALPVTFGKVGCGTYGGGSVSD